MSKKVYEIWEEKTGLPWSEAKKRGYTSGKYNENIALRNKLLNNEINFNNNVNNNQTKKNKNK